MSRQAFIGILGKVAIYLAAAAAVAASSPLFGAGTLTVPDTKEETMLVRLAFSYHNLERGQRAAHDARKDARIVLTPQGDAPEAIDILLGNRDGVETRLPVGSQWHVALESDALWSQPLVLNVQPQWPEHEIDVWPAALLSTTLSPSDANEHFASLPVRLRMQGFARPGSGPRQPDRPPQTTLLCSSGEAGKTLCRVPAARVDVALMVKGYAPVHVWGLDLRKSTVHELGPLHLDPGSSVAGWVENADGSPVSLEETEVWLQVATKFSSVRVRDPKRHKIKEHRIAVDASGFFQASDLEPGSYLVSAQAPGKVASGTVPAEVWPEKQTLIREPLRLESPLAVTLHVAPRLDWLGERWHARVHRQSTFTAAFDGPAVFDDVLSHEGSAIIEDQPGGVYMIEIFDSRGGRYFSEPDRNISQDDSDVEIEISLIDVAGQIRIDSKPLRATLHFGGAFGGMHVEMRSDEKGRFHGVLPRAGVWKVDIVSNELETRLIVDVETDANGRAALELELPGTRVSGVVYFPDGRTVPDAAVELITRVGTLHAATDDQGRFRFAAVPEGEAELVATINRRHGERWTSSLLPVKIEDDEESGPFHLSLRRNRLLEGRVVSRRGPVAGASVRVFPAQPTSAFPAHGNTDPDGNFSALIPQDTTLVDLVIMAPGHPLTPARVVPMEAPFEVEVGDLGGTLQLEVDILPEELLRRERAAIVYAGDLPIPLVLLYQWSRSFGGSTGSPVRLEVPNVQADLYSLCSGPYARGASKFRASATCQSGILAPGGVLSLKSESRSEED